MKGEDVLENVSGDDSDVDNADDKDGDSEDGGGAGS